MLLEKLLEGIEILEIRGAKRKKISDIKYDSREIAEGDIFICIPGYNTDGHLYVDEAVKKGAVAVFAQKEVEVPNGVTFIKVSDTRSVMGDLAVKFYDNPTGKLHLLGVTGTNGKTTVTYLIKSIFEKAGYKVGLLGTITNMIGEMEMSAARTTPESPDLQKLLQRMVEEEVDYVAMEVTSHALKLKRVQGCNLKAGIFTNISWDHLDFHESLEEYVKEKTKLFEMLGSSYGSYGVINYDDEYACLFESAANVLVTRYSINNIGDFIAREVEVKAEGVSFLIEYPGGRISLNLKLTGLFSVYNSLAAFVVGYQEGIHPETMKSALESCTGVPGRFEKIDCGQDFTVIVDYAHSPISLENILEAAKTFSIGRIITVFGCGGDRDRNKRPLMGEIAGKLSDLTVVTSDNPRSEDPHKIIADIEPGIRNYSNNYEIELDRKKAIELALSRAEKDDLVIIAGKGHETYQEVKGEKLPFDDREIAKNFLNSF